MSRSVCLAALLGAAFVAATVCDAREGTSTLIQAGQSYQGASRFGRVAVERREPFSFRAAAADRPFSAERLQRWIEAALRHQPGELDEPARVIATWTNSQLAGALEDFQQLRKELAAALSKKNQRAERIGVGGWRGTIAQAVALGGLTIDEARGHDASRIFERAAMLHTDIGTADMVASAAQDQMNVARVGSLHFGMAMALADAIEKDFPAAAFVRAWYTCTAAFLQRRHEIESVSSFLLRALSRFPRDPQLLLLAGAVHELLASPRIQNAVDFSWPPTPKRGDELRQAEKLLRGALAQNADLVEAQLRLGHVLIESGRYTEALACVESALKRARDPGTKFFAQLFIGKANEALGRDAAALTAYRQAHALFPGAQTPRLALSHLQHVRGDRDGAARELRAMVSVGTMTFDPWPDYFEAGHAELAGQLLSELRKRFREAGRP